jgi:hypothetical protein
MADQRNWERKAGKTKMTDSFSYWVITDQLQPSALRTNKIQCDLTTRILSIAPRYQTEQCYIEGSQASPARPSGKICSKVKMDTELCWNDTESREVFFNNSV